MALNLTVPALEEKPLLHAETRPQKLIEFIAGLPSAPLDAAIALHEEMEILNRQKVSADNRFKALEIYREKTAQLTKMLADAYCSATLPLSREAKTSATAVESLWLELAYGYKLALIDQLGQLFYLNNKATIPTIYRAIEALHQLSIVYYQTYFNVPDTIWRDLHQLYFHAAQQSIHDIALQPENKTSTIEQLYKQTLLLALADPRHLLAQDIELVADYIAHYAQHAQLQGLGMPESPAGIFIVDLSSAKPPIPYIKNIKVTDGDTDILFVAIELARLAHRHLQMLQSGNIPQHANLPAASADARYQDMLVYLIRHWGASPKRAYKRSSKNSISQLGIGFDATHALIKHAQQPQAKENAAAQPSAANDPASKISNWQIVNISAGGTALRKFPTVAAQVRIGDLLGIRNKEEQRWSIAVLRWAINGDHEQLEIGTQLIAPHAKAVSVGIVNSGKFEPALALPAVAATRQAATLVTRCGMYAPARVLEINDNGIISRIMITKLVEYSRNFERFQFSTL